MPFLSIFPDIDISEDEQRIIHQVFTMPVVKKYLHKMAYDQAKFAATASPTPGENPEDFLRKLATVHGRIEVLETLHSINPADTQLGA